MAVGGKKDVMQSIALSHIDGNIRNGLPAGSRLGSYGWQLLGSSNSAAKVISICKAQ